jgi:hypothetical protein
LLGTKGYVVVVVVCHLKALVVQPSKRNMHMPAELKELGKHI